MKVGHVIRAERVRQNMKQIVLAKGICTPSYLSKIERNMINPSEEVVELLMERLGMDSSKFRSPVESVTAKQIEKSLRDVYRLVITKRDKKYTREQLNQLLNSNTIYFDQSFYYTYLLIVFRFRLILGGDLDERSKELESFDELYDYFDTFQVYLYRLNKALFYYSSKRNSDSIENFELTQTILDQIALDDWETAEFHYMIGVAYIADKRILHSIEHVKKALAYFRDHFLMQRVMDCYILLGITHKQGGNFQEALDSYIKAQQICEEFNLGNNKGLILHNIGSLYSVMGNSELAIKYFEDSYHDKYDSDQGKLTSILCLVLEYSKRKDIQQVNKWCEIGILLHDNMNDNHLKSVYHQLMFLQTLYSDNGLSEEIAMDCINYFERIQNYRMAFKYSSVLADWYYRNRKYKLSSEMYAKTLKYDNIYRNVIEWEDL